MSDIYKNATYILAVPDLNESHLFKNTANGEMMELVYKYRDTIHQAIFNHHRSSTTTTSTIDGIHNISLQSTTLYNSHQHRSVIRRSTIEDIIKENLKLRKENEELRKENGNLKRRMKEDELKKAYQFLAYLLDDWSNRVWVISEYQIAKEKYLQHGTPLKYVFLSLLNDTDGVLTFKPFFSYNFVDQHISKQPNRSYNEAVQHFYVNNGSHFIQFLETVFIQRSRVEMLIGSNARRNEDRFYAILPTWNKKKHLLENINTISNWNITDMPSVKLKLYEILDDDDDDDFWDKARLLYMCSIYIGNPILPTFATAYRPSFFIKEIDNIGFAYERLLTELSERKSIKDIVKHHIQNKKHETIFKQNLVNIQFNHHPHQYQQYFLSVTVHHYFLFKQKSLSDILSQVELSDYSLNDNEDLMLIYLPFFIYDIPGLEQLFLWNKYEFPLLSGTLLLGNMWIQVQLYNSTKHGLPTLHSIKDYSFNIY
ncbi:unnamed protein product [Cunninghamella blakesleeana]